MRTFRIIRVLHAKKAGLLIYLPIRMKVVIVRSYIKSRCRYIRIQSTLTGECYTILGVDREALKEITHEPKGFFPNE